MLLFYGMKNIITNNSISAFLIGLAVFLIAPVAFAGGSAPIVETLGATDITENEAILNVYYTSRDAEFDFKQGDPNSIVTVEYGETRDLGSFTKSLVFTDGSRNIGFPVKNLKDEETYYYRAVLYYGDDVIYGQKRSFTTILEDGNVDLDNDPLNEVGGDDDDSSGGSLFETTNLGSGNSSGSTSGSSSSGSSSSGSVAGASSSAGDGDGLGTCSEYLCLVIDNDEDEVRQGDIVTYSIFYENISDIELENATLIIDIPEEMRVMSTSGDRVRESEGDLTVNLGDLRPGEDDTIKVTGRMSKRSSDDQVIARADVIYGVGSARNTETVTDFDIDDFDGIVGALGASAIGAGFFPTTIFGWLLLLGIVLVIIWAVRRFYYRTPLATEEYYPERNESGAYSTHTQ